MLVSDVNIVLESLYLVIVLIPFVALAKPIIHLICSSRYLITIITIKADANTQGRDQLTFNQARNFSQTIK